MKGVCFPASLHLIIVSIQTEERKKSIERERNPYHLTLILNQSKFKSSLQKGLRLRRLGIYINLVSKDKNMCFMCLMLNLSIFVKHSPAECGVLFFPFVF